MLHKQAYSLGASKLQACLKVRSTYGRKIAPGLIWILLLNPYNVKATTGAL